jgi:hypothetical protein
MEARLGAVAGPDLSDHFPARNGVADAKGREDRLVARKNVAGMRDRQHVAVDDESRIVHDAVRWGKHIAGGGDVDAAMAGRVPRGWGDERSHDGVGSPYRPRPVGVLDRNHGTNHEYNKSQPQHPVIVATWWNSDAAGGRIGANAGGMRPVGDRCYPVRSIPSNRGDYACPLSRRCLSKASVLVTKHSACYKA